MIIVLYHYPCTDGIFAALAMYHHYKCQNTDEEIMFIPHSTFKPLDLNEWYFDQNNVWLLDYVGPNKEFLKTLCSKSKTVSVIDHHSGAQELLESCSNKNLDFINLKIVAFNTAFSAAMLTLNHFKTIKPDSSLYRMFEYVQDNDLWKHQLIQSKEFSAGFRALNLNMDYQKNTGIFGQLLQLTSADIIQEGLKAIELENKCHDKDISNSHNISIQGFGNCLATFTTHPEFSSGLGNKLAKMSQDLNMLPVGIVYYNIGDQPKNYKISIRSLGSYDVSKIARKYHGNGHLNSAGFLVAKDIENPKLVSLC